MLLGIILCLLAIIPGGKPVNTTSIAASIFYKYILKSLFGTIHATLVTRTDIGEADFRQKIVRCNNRENEEEKCD